MTKVLGPLFSLAASGTYRRSLVFRTRQSGTHVARLPATTAPRSPGQTAHALKISEMSSTWMSLTPAEKAAWASCGAQSSLTGYQLYWREWIAQGATPAAPPLNPCP